MSGQPCPSSASLDYVLPLKWEDETHLVELTDYLRWLSRYARILVVDGSAENIWRRHHHVWGGWVVHLRPETESLNGKVAGVVTGLRHATAEAVVIADDDVRYDVDSLMATVAQLSQADLVGPQNVFEPMPWHAMWDTARSLLNRAVAADYPGTFAIRRSTFERMGGYSGAVLFENLELMRTVRAHGGVVRRPLDIYVRRRPASTKRFLDQRVRQAYDDLAQPLRLTTFLVVLPGLAAKRTRRSIIGAILGTIVVAEGGRRRGGGTSAFPRRAPLFAPVWVFERSVCVWVAVAQRTLLGGVSYGGQRIPTAAHSRRRLRQEATTPRPLITTGRTEPRPVGAVAERSERRSAAATQGDRVTTGVDYGPVDCDNLESAAQDQRTVGVGGDGRGRHDGGHLRIDTHTPSLPSRAFHKPGDHQ